MNPLVKNAKLEDNKVELLLSFSKDAVYFQGHFPEMPILPGFVQVHFAREFAKQYLKSDRELTNIKRLKFTKIISPEVDIILILEKIGDDKISFKYMDAQRSCSSGEFHLNV